MTILETIMTKKRRQFAINTAEQNCGSILETANRRVERPAGANPFISALRAGGINIIGEVKPSSPSAGRLLNDGQLDSILAAYKTQCAAVSVLTDSEYFGGSFELLRYVKQVTGLPILCKDFIVSNEQISLAKKHGADAVLLIAKVLSEQELISLFAEAKRQGLVAVVEVNDQTDIEKLSLIDAEVVLINNRNLDSMEIDIKTTERLIPLLNDVVIISASGIKTRTDINVLARFASNFLIGTSLMQSENLDRKLREFKRQTLIKVCGITSPRDAISAIHSGADYIGLIFAESSPRRVKLEEAEVIRALIGNRSQVVGVFQNQDVRFVNRVAEKLDLDLVQLHGAEDGNYIEQCTRPVIKALSYDADVDTVDAIKKASNVKHLLFDTSKQSETPGLESVEERLQMFAHQLRVRKQLSALPFFIAGKLTPDNVELAIEHLNPFAVDVASGVEIAPGIKSTELLAAFCSASMNSRYTQRHYR